MDGYEFGFHVDDEGVGTRLNWSTANAMSEAAEASCLGRPKEDSFQGFIWLHFGGLPAPQGAASRVESGEGFGSGGYGAPRGSMVS